MIYYIDDLYIEVIYIDALYILHQYIKNDFKNQVIFFKMKIILILFSLCSLNLSLDIFLKIKYY